jgi:hypothetical protein
MSRYGSTDIGSDAKQESSIGRNFFELHAYSHTNVVRDAGTVVTLAPSRAWVVFLNVVDQDSRVKNASPIRRRGSAGSGFRQHDRDGNRWRSLGDSNPCFRRERATSWAARRREQAEKLRR